MLPVIMCLLIRMEMKSWLSSRALSHNIQESIRIRQFNNKRKPDCTLRKKEITC